MSRKIKPLDVAGTLIATFLAALTAHTVTRNPDIHRASEPPNTQPVLQPKNSDDPELDEPENPFETFYKDLTR